MLAAIFYLAWKTQGHKLHALTWSLACVAMTVQWCISLGADSFPGFEAYWITVNAAGLAVMTLVMRGHCERTHCNFLPEKLWPYSAIILVAITWFTVTNPHVGLRTGILPAAGAIALFLSAAMVIRHRENPRPAEWATAITMVLFGCTQLLAATVAIMQGAEGDVVYIALYRTINLVSLPIGYTGVAMLSIFMLASDQSEQMREIAIRDQLTGLLNRRGFNEQSARAYATSRRAGRPVSVIMSDIDRFKNINDELGHAAGDEALRHIARILEQNRRAEDILARMGGEEFALVLPGCDIAESLRIANKLCRSLESAVLKVLGRTVRMTASFGVATISGKDSCLGDVMVRADKALFKSKRGGRNRVELDSSQIIVLQKGSLTRDTA